MDWKAVLTTTDGSTITHAPSQVSTHQQPIPKGPPDVKPVLQALLLADHIYQDRFTGKHVIAGIFSTIWFKADGAKPRTEEVGGEERTMIPGGMQVGSPYAYISLTNFEGTESLTLRYVDLADDMPLFEGNLDVTSDGRLKTVEIVAPLPTLPATKAGTFALELVWKDNPLGTYRVLVQEVPTEGASDDTDTNE